MSPLLQSNCNSVVDWQAADIAMICNPLGGWLRKHAEPMQMLHTALPEIRQIQATNLQEFKRAVLMVVEARVKWLIVVGGDGTLQGIIGCLFACIPPEQWPEITIVPAGTTNMTAQDLGMSKRADQVIENIRQYLQQGGTIKRVQRPVLRIEQAGRENVYGMMLGLGLIARGVKFSRSRIKQIGVTGNIFTILIVLRSLIGTFFGRPSDEWAPVRIVQKRDAGESEEKMYLFTLVSALEKLLLGIRPYWGTESTPLHVTLVEHDCKKLWRNFWPLVCGQGHGLNKKDGYHSYNTSVIELWLDDEYIVDGELYTASSDDGPLKITADGPIRFRVL